MSSTSLSALQIILRGTIAQAEALFQAAEMEIARLQTECDQIRADIVSYRYQLAPIARLPLEILREIFMECLPTTDELVDALSDEREDRPLVPHRANPIPAVLALVCKTWRIVSLGMPKLWSLLVANFRISDEFSQAELQALRLGVERSDAAPLTLIIFFENEGDGEYDPEGLVELLRSCSRRWHSVDWENPSDANGRSAARSPSPLPRRIHVGKR